MGERFNAFRDGAVHVLSEQCATCIFHPGNLMRLEPGRVKSMVEESKQNDSAIICHSTIYGKDGFEAGQNAICRGFWDRHAGESVTLRLAVVTDSVKFVSKGEE